jgi:hypothetical protein
MYVYNSGDKNPGNIIILHTYIHTIYIHIHTIYTYNIYIYIQHIYTHTTYMYVYNRGDMLYVCML